MSQTTLDIKEPGLNVLPPGVERHVVNGGGLTGFQIFPDDEVEIINNLKNIISWNYFLLTHLYFIILFFILKKIK